MTRLYGPAIALALVACSSEPAPERTPAAEIPARPEPSQAPAKGDDETPTPAVKAAPPAATSSVLTLEGLGPLRIGAPVPAGSGWGERFAQIPDSPCRTVSSPAMPGVYAIVEGNRVRRITLGEGSTVTLVEGIGAGATEAEVRAAFPGFREAPHQYVDPPGKYLTATNAASGDPALRFEIGPDGKVSLVHVGTMPVLGYVEGCA